jgi:hypothetical protein
MTKIRIALVAALLAGSASAALAQDFDPNLANRYPVHAGARGSKTFQSFQSAPVRLQEGRNVGSWQQEQQYTRRVPGNQGDTSYGGDWAQSYGGGW